MRPRQEYPELSAEQQGSSEIRNKTEDFSTIGHFPRVTVSLAHVAWDASYDQDQCINCSFLCLQTRLGTTLILSHETEKCVIKKNRSQKSLLQMRGITHSLACFRLACWPTWKLLHIYLPRTHVVGWQERTHHTRKDPNDNGCSCYSCPF